jgi:PAS domain S-box-containing protein
MADNVLQDPAVVTQDAAWFALVQQALPEAILVFDGEGRFLDANPWACQMLGYTRAELLAKTIIDIELDLDLPAARARWQQVQAGKEQVAIGRHRRKDGSVFLVEVRFALLVHNGQRAYASVVRDVAERTVLEQSLAESRVLLAKRLAAAEAGVRSRDAFLGLINHEFRTPLHQILGSIDLLRSATSDEARAKWLPIMEAAAERLLQQIDQSLEVVSLMSGSARLNDGVFAPITVLQASCAKLAQFAADKHVDVELIVSDDLRRYVRGDETRLGHALVNYLQNAIAFSQGRKVTVSTRIVAEDMDEVFIRFMVHDDGNGLSAAEKDKLFAAFVQGDDGLQRNHGGLGIGLFITKEFARLMDGQCGVDSEPGDGSTFWFTARFKWAD